MEIVNNSYMPGDPRLIDHIVYELKSKGIFDHFRKECIADVDTKPAYQNLRQRVEGSVSGFLKTQKWKPDMNKNHVREMLRKNISESGFLETGVERIVDQVVNPKINSIFLPQVEEIVYRYLGVQKPSAFDDLKADNSDFKIVERGTNEIINLLPNDLEAVSPESEPLEQKMDISSDSQKLDDSKVDEDESPPFEPLEELMPAIVLEENSIDSHISGFSGLASHDSNNSIDVSSKIEPMEISNQDTQFSKQSSDDHLSIVMSDDVDSKMEINEDSNHSKLSKATTDTNSRNFDFSQTDAQVDNDKQITQDKGDLNKKYEEKSNSGDKKSDKHKISDKHRSRNDSRSERKEHKSEKDKKSDKDEKDKKSDRDKKDYRERDRSKHSSKDGKDKDKEKKDSKNENGKDEKEIKSKSEKEHKRDKYDKDKNKSSGSISSNSSNSNKYSVSISNKDKNKKDSSNDKTKEKKESDHKNSKSKDSSSSHRDSSKTKEKTDSSKSKDDSRSRNCHSSSKSKSDSSSKTHSKHNGKTDSERSLSKSNKKDEKSSKKDDKHQSRSKKDEKQDKDSKRDDNSRKGSKDDHYGLKSKDSNRRSTDRDSSDGHSGTHSSSSSFADSSTSFQLQKSSQDTSITNSCSNSGDSGNSDKTEECVTLEEVNLPININAQDDNINAIQAIPPMKLIKPKFAFNIFEAKRLKKIRKKLGKIEKQSQMDLINAAINNSFSPTMHDDEVESVVKYEATTQANEEDEEQVADNNENARRRPNILKKAAIKNFKKKDSLEDMNEENSTQIVEVGDDSLQNPLQNSVVSKECWDAIEAKHLETMNYNSYVDAAAENVDIISEESDFAKNNTNDSKTEYCLYLSTDSFRTENYFSVVNTLIKQFTKTIADKENFLRNNSLGIDRHRVNKKSDDEIEERLPETDIVNVTKDNEIATNLNKTVKYASEGRPNHHNNNNKRKHQLIEDALNNVNHVVLENNMKLSTPTKTKKVKTNDGTVNYLDFSLPLSPAESDKSFTTTAGDNKKDDLKPKRNSNINRAANNSGSQRYSTDDLYKPRLQFSSSRRRAAKNKDMN